MAAAVVAVIRAALSAPAPHSAKCNVADPASLLATTVDGSSENVAPERLAINSLLLGRSFADGLRDNLRLKSIIGDIHRGFHCKIFRFVEKFKSGLLEFHNVSAFVNCSSSSWYRRAIIPR